MEIHFSYEDDRPPFPDIDENGFPVPLSDDKESGVGLVDKGRASTSDFALDFYRNGADWSSLLQDEDDELEQKRQDRKKKNPVQQDLFQVWGIKKPSEGSALRVHSPPRKRRMVVDRDSADCWVSRGESNGRGSVCNRSLVCPFYKKIPGTPFAVDAFLYGAIEGCSAYFLTHFHCDHYGGLSKSWSHGPIYCTPLTARLVKICLAVNPQYINPLELETECTIAGVKVTLLEANHCPGAAVIHFRLKDGKCYLHTGDFRASKSMQFHPLLTSQHINVLYLDTTYCNPKYSFPPKEDVLDYVVKATRTFLSKQPESLVVIGAYSIGKEPVYLSISKVLGVPIYTNASRRRILQSFGWPELSEKLCSCAQSSPLHVLPISCLHHEKLKEYLKTCKQQFKAVLAFRPTGWTFSQYMGNHLDHIRPVIKGNITIYGVPYSEHSSFTELQEFVKFLKPEKIIPTVNVGNATNRIKMQNYFKEWLKS